MRTSSTRKHDRGSDAGIESPYLDLAGEALLVGITREQVVAQLVSRIRRDQGYLAYRKACNRRTGYDDQVLADMRALALAAVLLDEDNETGGSGRGQACPITPAR